MSTTTEKSIVSPSFNRSRGAGQVNEAVRASLQALESARRAQRRRQQRDRALALLSAVLTVTAIWGLSTRFRNANDVAPPVKLNALTPPVAPAPTVQAPPSMEDTPVMEATSPDLQAHDVALQDTSEPAAPSAALPSSDEELIALRSACEAAAAQRRWRDLTESCGALFVHEPQAPRALQIALAHFRRDQVSEAGAWAERALALDAQLPEAAIIVAQAAEKAGEKAKAHKAYAQYLALAPRGWHASQARDGLARLR